MDGNYYVNVATPQLAQKALRKILEFGAMDSGNWGAGWLSGSYHAIIKGSIENFASRFQGLSGGNKFLIFCVRGGKIVDCFSSSNLAARTEIKLHRLIEARNLVTMFSTRENDKKRKKNLLSLSEARRRAEILQNELTHYNDILRIYVANTPPNRIDPYLTETFERSKKVLEGFKK